MPRNGSGTFTLPAGNPVTTGTTISSTWANTTLSDIGSALTTSISSDGQTAPSANLPMSGYIHTGVGNATVRTNYATAGQVQDGALQALSAVSGTNTITATGAVGMTTYVAGQTFRFIAAGTNTGATTININGIGAKSITKNGTTALSAGDIPISAVIEVVYDGTQFQLINIATVNVANATGILSQANGGTGTTTGYYGFKNRIINGAMQIDQRNAGASLTPTGSTYTVDRWIASVSQSSKISIQQNAGSVTPPAGYVNYLGVTSLSAYSVLSTDAFSISQRIEGLNCTDLGFGTASASTVTLSFWVRSSLTGTFGGSLLNSGSTRTYPFSYTISASNTWEQKTITIAGDTSGTWLTTSGLGLRVDFCLGAGSTVSGTAGSWASATYVSATGATSVVGTNGATFYITGVQLEKGSTATSFDYRPYGTELALCQRYYYVENMNLSGYTSAGTTNQYYKSTIVPMRGTPTFTLTSSTNTNCTASAITGLSESLVRFVCTGSALGGFIGASTGSLSAEL